MARLRITYSLSYDWLIQGRPNGDWRPMYERGLACQETARFQWALCEDAIFGAFEAFGLRFWEAWPAYPVQLPAGVNAFKEPLTFQMTQDWDDLRSVLIHELAHLHEDHPANQERYEAILQHIRATFSNEEEGVQYHLITCTLQRAVLMRVYPDRWRGIVNPIQGHPVLQQNWRLIGEREERTAWQDPLTSLAEWT